MVAFFVRLRIAAVPPTHTWGSNIFSPRFRAPIMRNRNRQTNRGGKTKKTPKKCVEEKKTEQQESRSHPAVRSIPSVKKRHLQASVTQPWLACVTVLMYLYSVPWVTLSGGAFHAFLRLSSSSGETRSSMVFLTASTEIISPSCTKAIGPPTWASGTTWPMQNP